MRGQVPELLRQLASLIPRVPQPKAVKKGSINHVAALTH